MNNHWHYLEQEMSQRRKIYSREFAQSRREQQRIQQCFKAVLKLARHFTSRGVKTLTGLVRRKGLSTFKQRKDTKETL